MAVLSKLPDQVQKLDGCLVFFRDNSMYGNIFLTREESTINILLKIVCRQSLTQKKKRTKQQLKNVLCMILLLMKGLSHTTFGKRICWFETVAYFQTSDTFTLSFAPSSNSQNPLSFISFPAWNHVKLKHRERHSSCLLSTAEERDNPTQGELAAWGRAGLSSRPQDRDLHLRMEIYASGWRSVPQDRDLCLRTEI